MSSAAHVFLALSLSTAAFAEEHPMSNLIANPGFEQGAANGPADWTYTGPSNRRDETWPDDSPHAGERCIRFRARTDHQVWESSRTPLRGGQPHRLEWWTLMGGSVPWHWTTHTGFVGVRVTYYDHAGGRCGIFERRTRAVGTEGWVRAWVHLDPPPETASCTVAFVCEADIATNGVVQFDDVCLEAYGPEPLPDGWGLLRGALPNDAPAPSMFAPGSARISVIASDGRRYAPRDSYTFLDTSFHALGEPFEVALPPGPAEVVASKGFEYSVWRQTVEIAPGEVAEVVPEVRRVYSLESEGWHRGDSHIHLFFHRHTRHPQMVPATVMEIAEAEGLRFLSFKAEEKEARAFIRQPMPWVSESFIGEIGIECVSDFHGHAYTVNARSVPADGFPMKLVPWPLHVDTQDHLTLTGGALAYGHPYNNVSADSTLDDVADPAKLLVGREWPVDVALGQTPAMDVLCSEGPGGTDVKLRDYYRMLNLRFRPGMSASTDAYVGQGAIHPGAGRTYVRVPELSWDAVATAYRTGATFVTNGPLLWLGVDGMQPGEELSIADGQQVEVSARAASNWGVSRAELIVGGEVVRTLGPGTDGEVNETFSLDVDASTWLALRAFGPGDELVEPKLLPSAWRESGLGQFAHTSPVYVTVGQRALTPDPEAARYFVGWIDAYRTALDAREDLFANDNGTWGDDVRQAIYGRLDSARVVYERLSVVRVR